MNSKVEKWDCFTQVAEEIKEAVIADLNSPHNDGPPDESPSNADNDGLQQNAATEFIVCDSAIAIDNSEYAVKNTNSASIERQGSFNVLKLKIKPAQKNYDTIPSQYDPKSNIERGEIFPNPWKN